MNAKVTTGIFVALLFGISVWNMAAPSRSFSENENRYLQQLPEFTVQRLFDGKYTAEFDTYMIDQFVARDSWVGAKTVAELVLQKHASNGVYFAEDGSLIEMFDTIDKDRFDKNLDYVRMFSEAAGAAGVTVNTILVPTASMIRNDQLPAYAPEVSQTALLGQAADTVPGFVDISLDLLAHGSEYIYYKTDHHWTSLGAYYGYNSFLRQTGRDLRPVDHYMVEVLSQDFYGTTWSKASLYTVKPDTISAYIPRDVEQVHVDYNNGEATSDTIYERSFLEVKDKYSVFLNANQSVTRISTGVANGKRLLLVKDSYANSFAQFLLSDYEEILMVDPRFYHSSFLALLEAEAISDVLVLYNLKGFSSDSNLYFLTT